VRSCEHTCALLTADGTGFLTGIALFRSQLRKDFQPACPARLTPAPGSLLGVTGLLVSIIAFRLR